jgi:ribosomal 30S subunit maturation factor RimM
VVNRGGQALGTIGGLRSSEVAGVVRQWLEVEDGESMLLIPLVGQYVDEVDAARRVVRVDWQRDW